MRVEGKGTIPFAGFPDFRANVTFIPLQFFTAVLPYRSRGCVRLVGYMLRKVLGWVDQDGNSVQEQWRFTYSELIHGVGISRGAVTQALNEAIEHHLISVAVPKTRESAASYTLTWSDHFTKHPMDFKGFFRREAVLLEEGEDSQTPPTPKAARKNIPNEFFDTVLRCERLSVARVVGTLLFKSIRWGPAGERKAPVSISISELSRLTHLSRQHVHEAVREAIDRGYVERVEAGFFDPMAGDKSHAATYRIRWISQPQQHASPGNTDAKPETPTPFTFLNPSKKVNGASVQKSERLEFKKVNDISIKTQVLKPNTTTEPQPSAGSDPEVVVGGEILGALLDVGFSESTARSLAQKYPAERIERQLAWFPLRKAQQNPLGYLRRAIEQDWSMPETTPCTTAQSFVAHFESTVHGLKEPMFPPSHKAQPEAEALLSHLGPGPFDCESAAEWGRRFGRFVLRQRPGKTSFAWCARDCGPEFIRAAKQSLLRSKERDLATQKETARKERRERYEGFLVQTTQRLKATKPDLWAEFLEEQDRLVSQFGLSSIGRQALQNPIGQALAFAEFSKERGEAVPSFEDWDKARPG